MGFFAAGAGAGLLNGLLGAGGGILMVNLLSRLGLEPRRAHATSLGVMLPLTLVSLLVYGLRGALPWQLALGLLVPALAGSWAGAALLPRLPVGWLKLGFSALALYSAGRFLLG